MDHFGDVDEALKAVESGKKAIRKGTSRQVHSREERDHMKTVATLWFQTLRPKVVQHVGSSAVEDVDAELRRVFDATAKAAARSTYESALNEARKALLTLRNIMPTTSAASQEQKVDDTPPDFSPLATDPKMQAIMVRRWKECVACKQAGAHLAAVVMMGGLLESLFVSKANHLSDKSVLAEATRAPKNKSTGKSLPFQKWALNDYIEVGNEIGWIGDSAKAVGVVLRDYRNFIHPQAEYSKGQTVMEQDARLLWDVTKAIVRELLA